MKLSNKGRIAVGKDADVLLLDKENRVYHLVANGNLMVKDGQKIKVGHFE